jgi:hypothetical protein
MDGVNYLDRPASIILADGGVVMHAWLSPSCSLEA